VDADGRTIYLWTITAANKAAARKTGGGARSMSKV
jgi:hypothetical protein